MHQQSDIVIKDSAKTMQEAVEQTLFIPGDIHVALHMMVLIYKLCYGGFQMLINWKQISKDLSIW